MKRKLLGALLTLSVAATAQINLRFVDAAEARGILTSDEGITEQWGRFDYDFRLKRQGGARQDFLSFAAEQTRDWTEGEKEKMQVTAENLNRMIREQRLNVPFPAEIKILKTTAEEEGGGAAGYTRRDYVVLREGVERISPRRLNHLLAHELFHILTRNHPNFRRDMYQLIGFHIAPEEFEFPADLRDLRISNPDVNRFDSYATFLIRGEKKDCSMLLYASSPYDGGSFIQYLTVGLLPVKDGKVEQKDGKSIIYSLQEADDFMEKVGKNTRYTIDPEEILAENFADVLLNKDTKELATPELQEQMRELLQK